MALTMTGAVQHQHQLHVGHLPRQRAPRRVGCTLTCRPELARLTIPVRSVTFFSFSTEQGYDKLSVYDGASTGATPLLTDFSGAALPSPASFLSRGSCVTVAFFSDESVVSSGFSFTFYGTSDAPTPGPTGATPSPTRTPTLNPTNTPTLVPTIASAPTRA
jgi:hypothetical protein